MKTIMIRGNIKEMRKRKMVIKKNKAKERGRLRKRKKFLIRGNLEIKCVWMMIFRKNCKGSCKEKVRIDLSDNNTFLLKLL